MNDQQFEREDHLSEWAAWAIVIVVLVAVSIDWEPLLTRLLP